MRLIHLHMKDFRQFFGDQKVDFAQDDIQNVTVLHGFNGSGKTALLNAFIWCLYGETTPDFEEQRRLFNETAAAQLKPGDSSELSVEVKFSDYQGEIYVAKRIAKITHSSDGKMIQGNSDLRLGVHRKSGEYDDLSGPQQYIDRHLPQSLYPFFFFNGERVEKLAGKNAYDRVEGGVKTLLNVEIFERAVHHLRRVVERELSRKLIAIGDKELSDKVSEREKLTGEFDTVSDDIHTQEDNRRRCEEEIDKIDQQQQSIFGLNRLIQRRREIESRVKNTKQELAECGRELKKILSTSGYLAFAEDVLSATQNLVNEARQKGDLPAKLKPQFVDDLIAEAKCICGRAIASGSQEQAALQQWRDQTGLAELQEAILLTSGAIDGLRQRRVDYFENIDRIRKRQDGHATLLRQLQDELGEVSEQIGERNLDQEVEQLEEQRRKATREMIESEQQQKRLEVQRNEIKNHLRECNQAIARLKLEDKKAKRFKRQLESVQNVASALQEICELQKQDVRRSLDAQVSEIWNDAAVKDYMASVSQDFRLELHKQVGGTRQLVHGASTGEKQVLALSFVGALVKRAGQNAERSRESKNPTDLIVGDNYPLVMDSPFGSLEPDYQKKIAEWIPTLSSQVVLMVSNSQWSPSMDSAFRGRIGKEYVLELHTPKEGTGQKINILRTDRPYVVETNDEFEYTEIKEVV